MLCWTNVFWQDQKLLHAREQDKAEFVVQKEN